MNGKHTMLSLYYYFCNIYAEIKCHYVMIHPKACKAGPVVKLHYLNSFHAMQKLETHSLTLLNLTK